MRARVVFSAEDFTDFELPEHITLAGGIYAQNSRTYVCRTCGKAWAWCIVHERPYDPVYSLCETCPPWGVMLPGSILHYEHFNDSLPLSLWQRELELHLNAVEAE